ncbi:MAG: hypothetical protein OEW87_07410 [Flavobacteriaceae bacterium]|nr:hypothetical protein [Flavobacteriaceae bacterium]
MKIHNLTIFFFLAISSSLMSQVTLNNYKYVTIPKKFDFLKSEDQYQLNSLTDFLFMKEGFKTLFTIDNKPKELLKDQCLGLHSEVRKNSGLFTTKLIIVLFNCHNEIVFTSKEGKSKEKDYKKAYHEALRDAFQSISELNYSYDPYIKIQDQVKKENEEIQEPELIEEIIVKTEKVQITEDFTENKPAVGAELMKVDKSDLEDLEDSTEDLLYAQPNEQGYQLVDSTPKVVYVLLRSSREDVFILKDRDGILLKSDDKWFIEYYEEGRLIKKEIKIKF